jgi:dynactin complex subunit
MSTEYMEKVLREQLGKLVNQITSRIQKEHEKELQSQNNVIAVLRIQNGLMKSNISKLTSSMKEMEERMKILETKLEEKVKKNNERNVEGVPNEFLGRDDLYWFVRPTVFDEDGVLRKESEVFKSG